eukprot:g23196.t3
MACLWLTCNKVSKGRLRSAAVAIDDQASLRQLPREKLKVWLDAFEKQWIPDAGSPFEMLNADKVIRRPAILEEEEAQAISSVIDGNARVGRAVTRRTRIQKVQMKKMWESTLEKEETKLRVALRWTRLVFWASCGQLTVFKIAHLRCITLRERCSQRKEPLPEVVVSAPLAPIHHFEAQRSVLLLSDEARADFRAAKEDAEGGAAGQRLTSRMRRWNPLARVTRRHVRRPFEFTVGQYNILAGYVGNNMEPWFLYGVDMPDARRRAIFQLHGEKLPNGQYANFGWPKYVKGVLTEDEIKKVEEGAESAVRVFTSRRYYILFTSELEAHSCYDVSYPAFLNSPRRCVAGLPRRGFGTAAHCFASIIIVGQEMLRAKQVGQVLRALVDFTTKHQVFEAPVVLAGDLNCRTGKWSCTPSPLIRRTSPRA